MMMRSVLIFGATVLVSAHSVRAQMTDRSANVQMDTSSTLQSKERAATMAVPIEWAGGALGSISVLYIAEADRSCRGTNDFLGCAIGGAAFYVTAAMVFSAAGAYVAGRIADTEPSVWGALAGSVVGVFAATGVVDGIENNLSSNRHLLILSYGVTQGLFTAIGSRIGARLR